MTARLVERPLSPARNSAPHLCGSARTGGARVGAVVLETVPDGPAAPAGIQTGDVITGLGGAQVTRVEDMLSILRRLNPGDVVEVNIERDSEQLVLEAELTERP